jgi:hypothetical protein
MLFEVVEVTSGYSWEKLVEVVRMRPVLGEWVRVLRVEEWSLSTRLALNELSSSPGASIFALLPCFSPVP